MKFYLVLLAKARLKMFPFQFCLRNFGYKVNTLTELGARENATLLRGQKIAALSLIVIICRVAHESKKCCLKKKIF